jgi:hypothetical protein
MPVVRIAVLGSILAVPALVLTSAAEESPEKVRLRGVLESVNVENATITLRFGRSIDVVLAERQVLRAAAERGKIAVEKATPDSDTSPKLMNVPVSKDAKIRICFRQSPSVANSLERTLAELEPMQGWPATVEVAFGDGTIEATSVVAWR